MRGPRGYGPAADGPSPSDPAKRPSVEIKLPPGFGYLRAPLEALILRLDTAEETMARVEKMIREIHTELLPGTASSADPPAGEVGRPAPVVSDDPSTEGDGEDSEP